MRHGRFHNFALGHQLQDYELPLPVIARVGGYALGAGLEIMAARDLRIATETSTVGMPEVRVGIPPVVKRLCCLDRLGWDARGDC